MQTLSMHPDSEMTPGEHSVAVAGRVVLGFTLPLALGGIMYDLSNDPGTTAPSPIWVVPLFFAAGMLVGLLWPLPNGFFEGRRSFSQAVALAAIGGVILFGFAGQAPPEVVYWVCAAMTAVGGAFVTSSLRSLREHRREDITD